MNAKTELVKRLVAMVSGNEPMTEEAINTVLKNYTIQRETEEERREFGNIWQQNALTAYLHAPLRTTEITLNCSLQG